MKVYLLRSENYEGVDIHGIYSSKEKAMEAIPYNARTLDETDIEEIEIDPPHGDEIYEHYAVALAFEDGEARFNANARLIPSEAARYETEYSQLMRESYGKQRRYCPAIGKTEDLAIQNAKNRLSQLMCRVAA